MDKAKNINVINNLNQDYKRFTFDFVGKRKIFFIITAVIFVAGMVSFFVRGFNWDIDFVGGTIIEYNLNKNIEFADTDKIAVIVEEIIGERPSSVVQSGTQGVVIKARAINTNQRTEITDRLKEEYSSLNTDEIYTSDVNPTVGDALRNKTLISVTLAIALMLVYITFRFNFWSGLATVICLTHDMFVALTFYSLLQIPMNTSVIAAFLTILAYSINATIIIFDRVRENMRFQKGTGYKFSDIINQSTSQTFARSINTTVTTLAVLVCVLILGVPSIKAFVLPLIVGIGAGLFSSLCLAGVLWDLFRRNKTERIRGGARAK